LSLDNYTGDSSNYFFGVRFFDLFPDNNDALHIPDDQHPFLGYLFHQLRMLVRHRAGKGKKQTTFSFPSRA
jgi:hypothetical protein